MMGFGLTCVLGTSALIVDWSRARIAGAEAQAIADAAAQAGVIALRSTGSTSEAEEAARLVVERNRISGMVPELIEFQVGGWDNTTRTWSGTGANAVRVTVGRTGDDAIRLPLAGLFGLPEIEVARRATASTPNLQVVLSIDITGSWDKDDFYKARQASVNFLELLHNAHGQDDLVGMNVFLMRYAWEFTPFTRIADSARDSSLVLDPWEQLNIGSLPGRYNASYETNTRYQYACDVNWSSNNFNNPPGGCFPNMPRYYLDESGTDHTVGIELARQMFQERPDPYAYRALIVLTDGKPVSYSARDGTARDRSGYEETRFREYRHAGGHTGAQIEADTVTDARAAYGVDNINVWFVSFVEYKYFMEEAAQGDGYFDLAGTASEIIEIFDQIGRSLPVTVVQ